jgi:hypothetical protein
MVIAPQASLYYLCYLGASQSYLVHAAETDGSRGSGAISSPLLSRANYNPAATIRQVLTIVFGLSTVMYDLTTTVNRLTPIGSKPTPAMHAVMFAILGACMEPIVRRSTANLRTLTAIELGYKFLFRWLDRPVGTPQVYGKLTSAARSRHLVLCLALLRG